MSQIWRTGKAQMGMMMRTLSRPMKRALSSFLLEQTGNQSTDYSTLEEDDLSVPVYDITAKCNIARRP